MRWTPAGGMVGGDGTSWGVCRRCILGDVVDSVDSCFSRGRRPPRPLAGTPERSSRRSRQAAGPRRQGRRRAGRPGEARERSAAGRPPHVWCRCHADPALGAPRLAGPPGRLASSIQATLRFDGVPGLVDTPLDEFRSRTPRPIVTVVQDVNPRYARPRCPRCRRTAACVSLDTPSRLVIAFWCCRVPHRFCPRFGCLLAGPSPPALASRRGGFQLPIRSKGGEGPWTMQRLPEARHQGKIYHRIYASRGEVTREDSTS